MRESGGMFSSTCATRSMYFAASRTSAPLAVSSAMVRSMVSDWPLSLFSPLPTPRMRPERAAPPTPAVAISAAISSNPYLKPISRIHSAREGDCTASTPIFITPSVIAALIMPRPAPAPSGSVRILIGSIISPSPPMRFPPIAAKLLSARDVVRCASISATCARSTVTASISSALRIPAQAFISCVRPSSISWSVRFWYSVIKKSAPACGNSSRTSCTTSRPKRCLIKSLRSENARPSSAMRK